MGFVDHYFKQEEVWALLKTWGVVSLVFTIFFSGSFNNSLSSFLFYFLLSLVVGAPAVILHELAHKFVAFRFGAYAEYRSDDKMLLLSIILSFFGILFLAPGGVYVAGLSSRKESALVSSAGPGANILLSLLFIPFLFLDGSWYRFGAAGLLINGWFALFNLIPVPPFDGFSVWSGSKVLYLVLLLLAIILVFVGFGAFNALFIA